MGTHSRLAPLVLFLAATGWCVWPYLSSSTPAAPPRAETASLDPKMLRPQFEPASERNLFQRPEPPRAPSPPPAPKAERVVAAAPPKVDTRREARPLAPPAKPVAKAPKPPITPEGLTLGGTLVRGKNRAAIINGKVYRPGEVLDHEPGDRVIWRLVDVRADGVVLSLKSGGRPAVLAFAEREDPGGAKAARTGPAAAARGSRATAPTPPPEDLELESSALERLAKISGGNVGQTYKNLWRLAVDPSVRRELLGQGPTGGPDASGRD